MGNQDGPKLLVYCLGGLETQIYRGVYVADTLEKQGSTKQNENPFNVHLKTVKTLLRHKQRQQAAADPILDVTCVPLRNVSSPVFSMSCATSAL